MKKVNLFLILLAVMAAACTPTAEPTSEPTLLPPTATTKPTRTPRPTLTPLPTPTPTPSPLTSVEIRELISPNIAYVETPIGSGSGVLIEDGVPGAARYLLTNAHVVWPYNRARVVFPDGTTKEDLPVVNSDLMRDLAVLGPIYDEGVSPLSLADGEALPLGSEVYLIGYPAEVERQPQPTMSRGILSRFRQWEGADLTHLQTDAASSGGQSGGVLVDETGAVIGLSSYFLNYSDYVLAISLGDVQDVVAHLIQGDDVDGLDNRTITQVDAAESMTVDLPAWGSHQPLIFDEPEGASIDIRLEGSGDGAFELVGPAGYLLAEVDETLSGVEQTTWLTEAAGPHYLYVYNLEPTEETYQISSNRPFAVLEDPDDGWSLALDDANEYRGLIGHPGDFDHFTIELEADEEVTIRVQSAILDPFLSVGYEGVATDQVIHDDDGGGGLFGLDALLTFRAPHAGSFELVVESAVGGEIGGYLLSITHPGADDPEPKVFEPTPAPISSPYGPLSRYEDASADLTFLYPASLTAGQIPDSPILRAICELEMANCLTGGDDLVLSVVLTEAIALGLQDFTIDDYLNLIIQQVTAAGGEAELVERQPFEGVEDAVGERVKLRVTFGPLTFNFSKLLFLHNGTLYEVTYIVPDDSYDEIISYSFDSVELRP